MLIDSEHVGLGSVLLCGWGGGVVTVWLKTSAVAGVVVSMSCVVMGVSRLALFRGDGGASVDLVELVWQLIGAKNLRATGRNGFFVVDCKNIFFVKTESLVPEMALFGMVSASKAFLASICCW